MLGKSLLFLSSCQKRCMSRRGPVGVRTSTWGFSRNRKSEGVLWLVSLLGLRVSPVLPGPGSDTRMKMGWKIMTKTEYSGVWFFRMQRVCGEVGTSIAHGRCGLGMERIVPHCVGGPLWFLVLLFVWAGPSYRVAYWRAVFATASRCVWRAVAPLMEPWCAEGKCQWLRT